MSHSNAIVCDHMQGYVSFNGRTAGVTMMPPPGLSKAPRPISAHSFHLGGSNNGLSKNIVDMKSLTHALVKCQEGTGEVARIICEAKFCPRLPGLTKLIGVLSKQHGAWKKSLEIYECVPSLGLTPDTALTNAAISACDRGGQWRVALKLWFAMDQRDNISYSAMISALAKGRQWTLALEVFCYMMKAGCCPDVITCCSLIAALDKGSYWQLAERVFVLLWTEQLRAVERLMLICSSNSKIEPVDMEFLQALWQSWSPSKIGPANTARRSGAAGTKSLWEWCHGIPHDVLVAPPPPPVPAAGSVSFFSLDQSAVVEGETAARELLSRNGFMNGGKPQQDAHSLPRCDAGDPSLTDSHQTVQQAQSRDWAPSSAYNNHNIWSPKIWDNQNTSLNPLLPVNHLATSQDYPQSARTEDEQGGWHLPSRLSMPDLYHYRDDSPPQAAHEIALERDSGSQSFTGLMSSLSLSGDQKCNGRSKESPPKSHHHLRTVASSPGFRSQQPSNERNNFSFINTICCNALLSAYANASPPQWERALLLLSAMQKQQNRIAADCVAYNTVMKACRAADRLDIAYKVFYYMLDARVGPSIATFNTMISAAMNKHEYELVVMLWRKIGEVGVSPSVACTNAVVTALQHLGRWEEALLVSRAV